MAAYPIPKPQYGIYNQNNFSPQTTGQTGLTIDEGKKYFLTFPNAQTTQTEYLNDIGVGGTATFENAVIFNDTVTYNADIEFNQNVLVDGTATVGGNLLCSTTAEIDGELTCNGGILMTPVLPDTNSIIDFVNGGGECQLYLDPTSAYDIVFQSSQSEGTAGLTVVNATSSFTMQCATIAPSIVGMQMKNPINMANNGLYGIQNIFINSNTSTPLITLSASTMNMNQTDITNIDQISIGSTLTTSGQISIASTTANYFLSSNSTYGFLVINNGGGADGMLTISNGSSDFISLSCTGPQILSIGGSLNMNDNDITSVNKLSVTSGQTLSIVDGITNLMTLSATGMNIYEDLGMNGYNIVGIDTLAGNGVNSITFTSTLNMNTNNIIGIGALAGTGSGVITCNSPLYMGSGKGVDLNGNAMTGCASISRSTGLFVTTNTPTTGDNSTNIATTQFVTTAISNIPAVSGFVRLTEPTGQTQTITTPITFISSPKVGSFIVATTNQLPVYTSTFLSVQNTFGTGTVINSGSQQETNQQNNVSSSAYVNFFSNPINISIGNVSGLAVLTPFLQCTFGVGGTIVLPWPNFPPPVPSGGYYRCTVLTTSLVSGIYSTIVQSWPVSFQTTSGYPTVIFYTDYNMGSSTSATYDFSSLGIFTS